MKTATKSTSAIKKNGRAKAGDDLPVIGHPSVLVEARPVIDETRWVPAEVHQTPAEVMKLELPKRINKLIQLHGTPLMVIDKSRLVLEHELFRKLLPRVRLFYAVKANPHPDVFKTFRDLGAGFDVASEGEMRGVLAAGVTPDRLIFANTVKRPDALQFARAAGVELVTFDNEPELYKIAKYAPGCRVLARIKVSNLGSIVELSLKFGCDADQVVPLLFKAKALGLQPHGISFHVGSQCTDYGTFHRAFETVASIVQEANRRELPIHMIDIGGGFPIRHFKTDTASLQAFGMQMRHELDRLFDKDIDIIAEPGRALVGPAGMLLTRVVGRSIRNNKNYYYLDDGVYGDFSGIVFDHCQYEFKTLKKTPKYISILAGPTCDSFDTISLSVELPELDVGDVVYVPNIGAYSCASALAFNGIPPAKVIVV